MSMLSFIEKFENRSERERGLKMITPKAPLACHEKENFYEHVLGF